MAKQGISSISKEIIQALLFLMTRGDGVVNIGYGDHITVNQMVKTIKVLVHSTSKVRYVAKRPGEIMHSYASVQKLSSWGFRFCCSLAERLKRIVNYFIYSIRQRLI